MPFLKYSRDKRGYEYVSLVQPVGRRGRIRSQVLYWYRTPPNVRVGREPFDAEVRRVIEAQNPDVPFNWEQLLATPKPLAVTPEAESWRERRRLMKARKAAATADSDVEDLEEDAVQEPPAMPPGPADVVTPEPDLVEEPEPSAANAAAGGVVDEGGSAGGVATESRRRRRRRRRGGRNLPDSGRPAAAGAAGASTVYADVDATAGLVSQADNHGDFETPDVAHPNDRAAGQTPGSGEE